MLIKITHSKVLKSAIFKHNVMFISLSEFLCYNFKCRYDCMLLYAPVLSQESVILLLSFVDVVHKCFLFFYIHVD